MLYNSFEFIFVFLPICLILYFSTAKISGRVANATLAALSLLFYSWLQPRDLIIIAASIITNFLFGLYLRRRQSKAVLTVAVSYNLVVLCFFKYSSYFLPFIDRAFSHPQSPLTIAIPLGISFFTFTQIAYLVDTYKRKTRDLSFRRYVLFVTFFPHLIAGPIVHHAQLMPQFALPGAKRWIPSNVSIGIAFFTLGLFKKVVIADSCAPLANQVFDAHVAVGFIDAWRGALAYTMQLYFDFSGYSDMAIGLAMMFNIRLPDNFDSPYKSANIVEFWRRWHMTLSRFLRDYLYIPLGGNRKGEARRQVNLITTMLLGGIWHGAGWTFAAWGLYHGVLLTLNHAWNARNQPMPVVVSRCITFIAVVIGWVLFRANTLHSALNRIRTMSGMGYHHAKLLVQPSQLLMQFSCIGLLLLFVNFSPNTKEWIESRSLGLRRSVILAMLFFFCLMYMKDALFAGTPQQFIYFQF